MNVTVFGATGASRTQTAEAGPPSYEASGPSPRTRC